MLSPMGIPRAEGCQDSEEEHEAREGAVGGRGEGAGGTEGQVLGHQGGEGLVDGDGG